MIVIMTGLPGTGKSTLARAIAERTGGIVLDKDVIRAAMFPGNVEYTTEQDEVVMSAMLASSEYMLTSNPQRIIVLDGRPFTKNSQLQRVFEFARNLAVEWRVIECVCSESSARERIESAKDKHVAANRDWNLYLEVKQRYETKPGPKTVLDTDRSLEACVAVALRALSPASTASDVPPLLRQR